MSKEYFIDNISDETLAKLTDRMVKFERRQKNNSGKFKMNNIIFKIIPAVAVFLLVFVLANNLNIFSNIAKDTGENETNPSMPGVAVVVDEEIVLSNSELTEIPRLIEKSLFEYFMINIPKNKAGKRVVDKMKAYYILKDIDGVEFYVFTSDASDREIKEMLGYWNEYTSWSDIGYHKMLEDYNLLDNELAYDPYAKYAHVRFGNTKDILLLEVEWYTVETYTERIEELKKQFSLTVYDEDKKQIDEWIRSMEEDLELIKEGKYYTTRLINGKEGGYSFGFRNPDKPIETSQYFDKDGYYIFYVYPYYADIMYHDEDNVVQFAKFTTSQSKREYERTLKNEIIPFCDDLLERGLIPQERYDIYTTLDPLDYYVSMFFD